MNKKILVVALLALQVSSQVCAAGNRSGASTAAIDAALQAINPSATTWGLATNANAIPNLGEVGPAISLANLASGTVSAPAAYTGFDVAWFDILAATNFISLTGLPDSTALSSFFAITLVTTSASSQNGPSITYHGPGGSSAVCGLYDSKANAIPATYSPASNTFVPRSPQPLPSPTGPIGYSGNPIFPSGVKPSVGTPYYLICAGYSTTGNLATGVGLTTTDFTITW